MCPREDLPEGMRHMTRNLEIQRELVELKETLGINSNYSTYVHKKERYRLYMHIDLGIGNFGSVMRGILTEIGGKKVDCAVKMLKTDEVPNRKVLRHCIV